VTAGARVPDDHLPDEALPSPTLHQAQAQKPDTRSSIPDLRQAEKLEATYFQYHQECRRNSGADTPSQASCDIRGTHHPDRIAFTTPCVDIPRRSYGQLLIGGMQTAHVLVVQTVAGSDEHFPEWCH